MQVKFKKTYYLKKRAIGKNDEGMDIETFADIGIGIEANIQPATSKVQAELYGVQLNYMMNMYYDGEEVVTEGDGICVNTKGSSNHDYIVQPIKIYNGHKVIELKKVRNGS
ncbi:hypothetical protein H7E67_01190 [Clostridium gasigenes]|uniref:hypothetical protein n=1 Tax=Clostridium gasigenes TaxID=94869 RepID=UPI00162A9B06|nr:hypothetical protein [Clostridium gasigenes]MBB6622034.1 hypothetical protein [Clostridium gasigenes]